MSSTADLARAHAERALDDGTFASILARRVAIRTVSSEQRDADAWAYLQDDVAPELRELGCDVVVERNADERGGPLLLARRDEAGDDGERLPTVLLYGHADVVEGQDASWSAGRSPWRLELAELQEGPAWFGRGSSDNKGQHTVTLLALRAVLAARGRLGFSLRLVLETSEEIGSPGLEAFLAAHRADLDVDVFLGSDGPRTAAARPTVFLGGRGVAQIDLVADLREGAFHPGNWGGYVRNAATTIAGAIGALVDAHGRILVPGLLPRDLPESVRASLRTIAPGSDAGDPAGDDAWGEPTLTAAERIHAWSTLEVTALTSGDGLTTNAIPGIATASLQLRFVVGTDVEGLGSAVRHALDDAGLDMVDADVHVRFPASRSDPDGPWLRWVVETLRAHGDDPAVLPNIGGSLPSHVFASALGTETLWLPHSHPGCRQHGPDEHLPVAVARDALRVATTVLAELGDPERRVALPARATGQG